MRGIDVFRRYFKEYQDQYVLIGGAACDLLFGARDTEFRATKDLDVVLLVEALTPEFGKQFWAFVRDGGYEHRAKSSGHPQFYRFDRPKDPSFPEMIELFSRKADTFLGQSMGPCVPLPLGDEVSSLSAILLNEDYYQLLLQGRTTLEDVTILSPLYLIPFKVKAWLDLTARREQGQQIDGKDIKKHKNDVVRLTTLLLADERCQLPAMIQADMAQFIAHFAQEPVDPKALHLRGVHSEEILQVLQSVYL